MEKIKSGKKDLFQLRAKKPNVSIKGNVFQVGRFLIGRVESCDFIISQSVVSAVHAVIEVTPSGAKIYDMNSTNGTCVNGEKVIATSLTPGDTIQFGNIEFIFEAYNISSALPPVLDSLELSKGNASIIKTNDKNIELPKGPSIDEVDVPYIVYPLGNDPKAEFSEYIFEDTEQMYPIFKYELGKQAVEIMVLLKDRVVSVDYIPEKNGIYSIVGAKADKKTIEFAYLGKTEKVPFVEIRDGSCLVHKLHSFEGQHLTNGDVVDVKGEFAEISDDEIIRFENQDLEVYVRRVSAPPKVKAAPFFRREKGFWRFVLLALFFFAIVPIALTMAFKNDEEMKREPEPERIARILYKTPLRISNKNAIEKTKKEKKVKQRVKNKVAEKKPEKKPEKQTKPKKAPAKSDKKIVKEVGAKAAKKVQKVKKVRKPIPKRSNSVSKSRAKSKSARSKSVRKSAVNRNTRGAVDTYKSFDFQSTISSSMAKGGSTTGTTATTASASSVTGSSSVGGGVATNIRKANTGTSVGSLTGATEGKLAQSKGAEGLTAKRGVYTAGIPSETVVLGSMDPDDIRRLLREHIPQFRSCYQRELDRNVGRKVSGTIKMNFAIGASGHVTRAGISGRTQLPSDVRRCVINVLRGIQFPRPMGGGTVDVKQPFNFLPKNI